jgi:hypothetical protein
MPVRTQLGKSIRRLAPVALMPAAAIAVHQLRYWLAFGGEAGAELQRQGHGYLHSLVPWIILAIALVSGAFLRALGRAFGGESSPGRYAMSFLSLWLSCALCLVVIYTSQEFLEGLFATGHPAGLAGIFGYGGAWSIPAALAVGLVLAAVFHAGHWVLRAVAQWRAQPPAVRRRPAALARPRRQVLPPRLLPLGLGWSGRGPPR